MSVLTMRNQARFSPPAGLIYFGRNQEHYFFSGPQSEREVVIDPLTGEPVLLFIAMTVVMFFGEDIAVLFFHRSLNNDKLDVKIVIINPKTLNQHSDNYEQRWGYSNSSACLLHGMDLLYDKINNIFYSVFFSNRKSPAFLGNGFHQNKRKKQEKSTDLKQNTVAGGET